MSQVHLRVFVAVLCDHEVQYALRIRQLWNDGAAPELYALAMTRLARAAAAAEDGTTKDAARKMLRSLKWREPAPE